MAIQLISGDGRFDISGMEHFSQKMKLDEHKLSYAVVSIIGPQSSGKSTLLNHLFGTNFREMDATVGRFQTTQGIWLAKAASIDTCTLVVDVEGMDGEEIQIKENVTFEKHSALFALAMSDVLLVNLWCHDIGREHAGCWRLLKTVFQVVMRLITPRKRTLLFVIRDKRQTPLEILTKLLQDGIQKIFDSVPKPEAHKETKLSNYFDVDVTSLSSYEHQKMAFKEEIISLRQRFINSTTSGGLAGDQQDRVPASEISFSAQKIWQLIKEDKDLDLPAHKIMVAAVRCEKILNDKFADFVGSEDWRHIEDALKSGPVLDFGKKMTSTIYTCLSEYDQEALCIDEGIRCAKRLVLQDKLLQLVQPAYQSMIAYLHGGALYCFQGALHEALESGEHLPTAAQLCSDYILAVFDEECKDAAIEQANWDSSDLLDKLQSDIRAHVALVHAAAAQATAAQATVAAAQATAAAAQAQAAAAQAQAAAAALAAAHVEAVARGRRSRLLSIVTTTLKIGARIAFALAGVNIGN